MSTNVSLGGYRLTLKWLRVNKTTNELENDNLIGLVNKNKSGLRLVVFDLVPKNILEIN